MHEDEAEYVAELFYQHWVCRYGCPNMIKSDNGSNLLAIHHFVQKACDKNVNTSSPHNPMSHGIVERVQQLFGDQIVMQMQRISSSNWAAILPSVLAAVRFSTGSRGISPYEIVFGSVPSIGLHPSTSEDVSTWGQNITTEHVNQISRKIKNAISTYKQRSRKQPFAVGDIVRVVRVQAIGGRVWSGPYVVLGLKPGNALLSNGRLCASHQLVKINLPVKSIEQCNDLVDTMIATGQSHHVDEMTGEIIRIDNVSTDEELEGFCHQYDFAKLFRSNKNNSNSN